jgi:hypothetical protein
LAARYRDPSRDVGNLEPGATLFRPEPVESFPFCPYSADQIIAAPSEGDGGGRGRIAGASVRAD